MFLEEISRMAKAERVAGFKVPRDVIVEVGDGVGLWMALPCFELAALTRLWFASTASTTLRKASARTTTA